MKRRTFTLSIDCENAAFGETDRDVTDEVARILGSIIQQLDYGAEDGRCIDANGNVVGHFILRKPEDGKGGDE